MRNNGLLSFWPLELSRYQVHNHIEDVVFTNFAECSLLFFQNFKCRHELIKMLFQDMNGHVVSASFVQSDQTFIDIQIEWTLLPSKLTHPLRIDEWKMKFPCKMVPFQVVYSFFFFWGGEIRHVIHSRSRYNRVVLPHPWKPIRNLKMPRATAILPRTRKPIGQRQIVW